MQLVTDGDPAKRLKNLLFQIFNTNTLLRTFYRPWFAPGAMVIEVARTVPVDLVLGGDQRAAFATPDQAGKGELVPLGVRPVVPAQNFLDSLEFLRSHHWFVRALEDPVLAADDPAVEGIGEQPVESIVPHFLAAAFLVAHRSQPPLFIRDAADFRNRMGAVEQQIPRLAHQPEPLRIFDDRMVLGVVEVTKRRHARQPTLLQFGFVAPFYVFAQAVHVVLRLAKEDVKHKLALRSVFKTVGREFEIGEFAVIQKVDDLPAVNRVAGQPVRMPGDDPVGFASFDALNHAVEKRTAWLFGALRFAGQRFNHF